MTPPSFDNRIEHYGSHYIVPASAPVHVGGPYDRFGGWRLYGPSRQIDEKNLSTAEKYISMYLQEQENIFQFHHGIGIFFALLTQEEKDTLWDKKYDCRIHMFMPRNISEILADLNRYP